MSFGYSGLIKGVAGSLVGVGSIVSGVKVGGLFDPIVEWEVEKIDVKERQKQYEEVAEKRQTTLAEFEGTGLFVEGSYVTGKPNRIPFYLTDLLHKKEDQEILSYIVNKKGDNIRVSINKPDPKKLGPESIYYGWILSEFRHVNISNAIFYGFCAPKTDWPDARRECENLPDGWTVRHLEVKE